jgi:hypothetical protein
VENFHFTFFDSVVVVIVEKLWLTSFWAWAWKKWKKKRR